MGSLCPANSLNFSLFCHDAFNTSWIVCRHGRLKCLKVSPFFPMSHCLQGISFLLKELDNSLPHSAQHLKVKKNPRTLNYFSGHFWATAVWKSVHRHKSKQPSFIRQTIEHRKTLIMPTQLEKQNILRPQVIGNRPHLITTAVTV